MRVNRILIYGKLNLALKPVKTLSVYLGKLYLKQINDFDEKSFFGTTIERKAIT